MMSAAACSRAEECLRSRPTLQGLQIEVTIVDSNAFRCFRRNQAVRRCSAGLRDGFNNTLPLSLQIADSLSSNPSTTGAFEVRHVGSDIENVSIAASASGSCLNQPPRCRIDDGD